MYGRAFGTFATARLLCHICSGTFATHNYHRYGVNKIGAARGAANRSSTSHANDSDCCDRPSPHTAYMMLRAIIATAATSADCTA